MLSYRDLATSFKALEIDPDRPVVAHASLSAFGQVQGGAETVVGALLATFSTVLMPTFTYKTMLTPEAGPPDNALLYGSGQAMNAMAEFYRPDMPADRLMGAIPEALRCHPAAQRSSHPILSFSGVNAAALLEAQTLKEPLAPIQAALAAEGWVLLLGVTHMVNTSIHLAERLAGRRQFIRWALTPRGVLECPGFPGCSDGFDALAPDLEPVTRKVRAGAALVQAVPLRELVVAVHARLAADPLALLCSQSFCMRCEATRADNMA